MTLRPFSRTTSPAATTMPPAPGRPEGDGQAMAAENRRPGAGPATATLAAIGWVASVAGFGASAAADAAWGWDGAATTLYGLTTLVLVASGALLVATQVQLGRAIGRLGPVATAGIGFSALGVLLSFVAWAVVVWATVLGIGTLLFGVPLLRRDHLPRPWGQAVTFAVPVAAVVAWAGAVLFDAGAEDASPVVVAVGDGLVAAALLVLAVGLAGLGRMRRVDPPPTLTRP